MLIQPADQAQLWKAQLRTGRIQQPGVWKTARLPIWVSCSFAKTTLPKVFLNHCLAKLTRWWLAAVAQHKDTRQAMDQDMQEHLLLECIKEVCPTLT